MEQHLISRGMNPDLYRVFYHGPYIATFLLYNLSGQIVGYQKYNKSFDKKKSNDPKTCRYYTYLPREVDGVFGLDILNPLNKKIFFVEGIFKASNLHRLGYNSIAVLTSTPKRLKPWIKIMKQTWKIITIGDNDRGGSELVKTIGYGIQSPIDLDEMFDEDIIELVESL